MLARALPMVAAVLAALHAASFLGYGPVDDDFIAYRYARNLAEGFGPVFNTGERVEGFSAPGWMLAVAAALKLGVEAPLFSVVASIAASAVAAFAIAKLWQRRHPHDPSLAPALLLAASPAFAWHAIAGLGTVVVAALLALWLEAWDRAARAERSTLEAALWLGLAALVRNEAILFALPFAWIELRRRRLASVVIAFAPLIGWQVFRVAYYGRWTPITYDVKKIGFFADLRLGLQYLAASSATTGFVVALAFAWIASARKREAQDVVLRAATFGASIYAAYIVYVGGDFLPLARFFVPLFPIVIVGACEGVLVLAGSSRGIAVVSLVVALALEQVAQRERFQPGPGHEQSGLWEMHSESEQRWELLGREVARCVAPGTKVALAPIGAFGYESRLAIVDLLGLTNTAVSRAAPDPRIPIKGHQRYDADWVIAQRPEMIVLGNGWLHPGPDGVPTLVASPWERTLVMHRALVEDYEPLKLEIAGSYPLIFYWRRDVERPLGATEPGR